MAKVTNSQRAKIKEVMSLTDPQYKSLKWAGNALLGRRPRSSKWETVLTASQTREVIPRLKELSEKAQLLAELRTAKGEDSELKACLNELEAKYG